MKRIATCCFTGHRPEKLNVPEEIVIEKELPNLRSRIYNKLRTLESPKQLFKVFIDLINKKKNKSTINNTESNLLLSVFDAF